MVMGVEGTKAYLLENTPVQAHLIYVNGEGEYETFTSSDLKERILED